VTACPASLSGAAVAVLASAAPDDKVQLSRASAAAWRSGLISEVGALTPPARPARPPRPDLRRPADMPKRRAGGEAGRVALLHALAHIELNAIDLAWDLIARFPAEDLPRTFYDDWVTVAAEEAEHFALLSERLAALGASYGDLPAHDGLWQAATETAGDALARLAVVPLVLEARGLDVTPAIIERLHAAGDAESAAVLQTVYDDEIGHVATGKRWFDHLCTKRGLAPVATWQALVRRHFKGRLKPPFNEAGRAAAGFGSAYYAALASG
jgi:uncharacterized ferritin-like protein (DUF455 family)